MESDDYIKECIKYSFGIFSRVFDLVLNVEDENYINLVPPIIQYFYVFKNQSNCLFYNYPLYNWVMNKLYQFCSERLYRKFSFDSETL